MSPHLSTSGRVLLVAAATLMVVGVVATQWRILLWGETLVVLVAAAYTIRLAVLLAIEGGFVGLAVKGQDRGETGGGTVDQPQSVELEVVNLSGATLNWLRLEPECSVELSFDPLRVDLPSVRGHQRLSFSVQVAAAVPGRWMLHGFRLTARGFGGLVEVSDYIAIPYPFRFLPATMSARRALPKRDQRFAEIQRSGTHLLWQRGSGTDFRELRDHVHGDPFRSIAWKATARMGQLMVRQFEDETITNTVVLLDISSTMRAGSQGRTKLHQAVELLSEMATAMNRSRDRLGLITFDEVVYGHIRTAPARVAIPQVVNHLAGLWSMVDNDFTEADEEDVALSLVDYLAVQERLDFRTKASHRKVGGEAMPYDHQLLLQWLLRVLPRETERLGDPMFSAGVLGYRQVSAIRRFCQLRGLPLAYRHESRFGAKEGGMVQALERFLRERRDSHLVILLTDLCALWDMRRLVSALTVVLGRKHRVVVLMPTNLDCAIMPVTRKEREPGMARSVVRLMRLAEQRERSRTVDAVASLGIKVIPVEPGDTLERLLARTRLVGWMP